MIEKENIVTKKEKFKYIPIISDDVLKKALTCISSSKREECYSAELLANIRNKMAHGDYEVNVEKKGIIMSINSFTYLLSFPKTMPLVSNIISALIKRESYRYFIENLNLAEKTLEAVKSMIDNAILVEYTIKNNNGDLTNENLEKFHKILEFLYREKGNGQNVENEYKNFKELLKKEGLELNRKNIKMNSQLSIELLYNIYIYINEFKSCDAICNYVSNAMYKILSKGNNHLRKGSYLSLLILNKIFDNTGLTDDIQMSIIANNLIEITVFHYISAYNVLYNILLDNTYIAKYNIDINSRLDFDKLKLDRIKPSVCKSYTTQYSLKLEECKKIKTKIESLSTELEKQKINCLKIKKMIFKNSITYLFAALNIIQANRFSDDLKKHKNVSNIILKLSNDISKLQKEYENNYNECTCINNDSRNLAIIKGIRNSIAHGNIQITYTDPIMLTFKDIYRDELCFELKISLDDFKKVFLEEQDYLLEFLEEKDCSVKQKVYKKV